MKKGGALYHHFMNTPPRCTPSYLALAVVALACAVWPVARAAQDGPAPPAASSPAAAEFVELHRLRIVNATHGAIQISTDAGATWRLLGRVVDPAVTVAEGYLAANYADPGTVSALSLIHI